MMKQQFVDKRDETDSVFDSRMAQLTESGKQFDKLLTKEEFHEGCDKLLRGQAKMMVILTRIDQERAATNARIDRVERDLFASPAQADRSPTPRVSPSSLPRS